MLFAGGGHANRLGRALGLVRVILLGAGGHAECFILEFIGVRAVGHANLLRKCIEREIGGCNHLTLKLISNLSKAIDVKTKKLEQD